MTTRNTSKQAQEFKGLSWDEPLTPERIKYIKDTFGPLLKNLNELAALIRGFDYIKLKDKEDACLIEVDRNIFWKVSRGMYGPAIRVLASAKFLRKVIESVAGGKLQARKFYEAIFTSLIGKGIKGIGTAYSAVEFRGRNYTETAALMISPPAWTSEIIDRNQVVNVGKTLEKWQEQVEHLHRSQKILDLRPAIESVWGHVRYDLEQTNRLALAAQPAQGTETNTEPPDKMSKSARALAVLQDHPDWTNKQIAEVAGVNVKSLSRMDNFRKAREILKTAKSKFPTGSRSAETGDIEAWNK